MPILGVDVGLDDLGHRLGLLRCAERGGKVSLHRTRGVAQSAFRVRRGRAEFHVTNRCRRAVAAPVTPSIAQRPWITSRSAFFSEPKGTRARRPRTTWHASRRAAIDAQRASMLNGARVAGKDPRRARVRVARVLVASRKNVRAVAPDFARTRARARVARRTWTLDALRAATEPVKVEAMQAIVVVWCLVEEGCVCRNGDRDARQRRSKTFFLSSPITTDKRIRNGRHSLAVKRQPRPAEKAKIERRLRVHPKNDRESGFF